MKPDSMPEKAPRLSHTPAPLNPIQQASLTRYVMRRQLSLSLSVAAVFILLLVGLPLFNLYAPQIANQSVYGLTLTWLFLGVIFYPITIALSIYFVRNSDRIEAECARWQPPELPGKTNSDATIAAEGDQR